MFFSLEKQTNRLFPCCFNLGSLVLNTDQGWTQRDHGQQVTVFKGYAEQFDLAQAVLDLKDDVLGNFAVFVYDKSQQTVAIKTNQWRGFKMFYAAGQRLTNLLEESYTVWNDSAVWVDQNLTLMEVKQDIIGSINTQPIDRSTALNLIDQRLRWRIGNFVANNRRPLKIFLSGGVDSMLVYSYIKNFTDQYQLVLANVVEWDKFWCMNQQRIRQQFWGYNQIHHWIEPCVLSSGAPGDEFMLRSPTTANIWLKYRGTSIPQQMKIQPRFFHRDFFSQPGYQQLFEQQNSDEQIQKVLCEPRTEFDWYLCNNVVNDCQHWHLGNTLTFTPLRDLEIFKIMLRLDLAHGVDQIMNSSISLDLILRNDPDLLNLLGSQKNSKESLTNLSKLLCV